MTALITQGAYQLQSFSKRRMTSSFFVGDEMYIELAGNFHNNELGLKKGIYGLLVISDDILL